jgi:hypothetical protein
MRGFGLSMFYFVTRFYHYSLLKFIILQIYHADFIETSAKTGQNVGNACLKLLNLLVKNCREQGYNSKQSNKYEQSNNSRSQKGRCCQ